MTAPFNDWYRHYDDPYLQIRSPRAPPNLRSQSESPINQSFDGSRQPLDQISVPSELPQGQRFYTRPQLPGIKQIMGISHDHSYDQKASREECVGKSSHRLLLAPIAKSPGCKPQKQTRSAKEDKSTLYLSSPLQPKEAMMCSLFSDEETHNNLEQWTNKYPYVPRSQSSFVVIDELKLADAQPQQLPLARHVEEITRDDGRAYEELLHDNSIFGKQIHEQKGSEMEITNSGESLSKELDGLDTFVLALKRRQRHTGEGCV